MLRVCAKFETILAAGISASALTAVLSSNATGDRDESVLPDGTYGFVIDEGNSNEEFVIAAVSGTSIAFASRGLAYYDGDTEVANNKKAHRKGASIKITDHPALARVIRELNGDDAFEAVPKLPAVRTISLARHLVDKEYADAIAAAGVTSLAVTDNGGISVNVGAGYYAVNGDVIEYAGASAQALTDDATNYIQLKDKALDINASAFDDDAIPLAKAVCASGDITSLTDCRAFLSASDIKADSGLARDANGIYIDLDSNGGLAFSGGKLAMNIAGAIMQFAGSSAPTGWLICDGSAVSRTTYASLFAVIGETYGVGDGSTTFNLPNLKGRIPVGKDAAQTEFDALGETGGEKTHALTVDEIPAHSHDLSAGTNSGDNGATELTGSGTITTTQTGGGQAHNNLQPYLVLNYIIKI